MSSPGRLYTPRWFTSSPDAISASDNKKSHQEAQPATPVQTCSASAPAAFKGACHNCGEKVHRTADCPKPKRTDERRDCTPGRGTGKGKGKGKDEGKGKRTDNLGSGGSWGNRKICQGDDKSARQS